MLNFFTRKSMTRFSLPLLLAAAVAMLTGCGGGGSGATAASGVAAVPTATSIQLLVSSPQMLSSATATTGLTAVVLDGSGQAMAGKVVTFSKGSDSTAYFNGVTPVTSTNGVANATLNIGTNMANRVITVTATSGTAVGTATVTVINTKIAISGNTSLALNASSTLTLIVKDSTGVPVPGVPLTVVSANGNPIALSPSTGITDATGQITATVTANNAGVAGTDTITVTGAGATQTQALTINGASFAFKAPLPVAPATVPQIVVNTPTTVSVRWINGVTPVVGSSVSFSSSRGTITCIASCVTDSTGAASATVSAASTGATIITASGPGGTPAATMNVAFITTSASSVVAQASPSTVAVNTIGSTTNQSVISVVVRDANNNLVQNAHLLFTQLADPSGGSLAAATATTDITGTASVNYIAGTTFSPQNAVQIKVALDSVNGVAVTPISQTVLLTVASQSLFVRLGTDNTVTPDSPVVGTYTKKYTALVTDSAGNPAPDGTQVRFVLRPTKIPGFSFFKGRYIQGPTTWVKDGTVGVGCVSEDTNANGILDPGEDLNGNGFLDPTGVATVNTTATTVGGFATASISYAKQYATWVVMDLEARAGTVGNDPPSVATVPLPGLAADYANLTVSPPGQISPYGAGQGINAVCTNTL